MHTDTTPATIPADGYMRLPAVLAVIPVSASTWWAMVRRGDAPQPVRLGPRCTAWRSRDIRNLVESIDRDRQPVTPAVDQSWRDRGGAA